MKIKKRFVAFMMAILMVLTSITIQYRKSEAATVTATITVNFTSEDEGKTVTVAVGDKSFEGTVTKINIPNEDGTLSENYKYQVTGELEAETGDNTAIITCDNGNSVYSAKTALKIPETADETGKFAVTTGDVRLLLTTVKEVTVTGVDGYTFTSVTGAERVGDTWKFTKTDGFKVGQDSFTINANDVDGNVFKATITVSGESVGANWEVVGFKSIKINLPEGYESCGLQTGSNGLDTYDIDNNGKVTTKSGNLIAPGAQITIVAYKEKLKYETTVTVGNSATITAGNFTAKEFKLNLKYNEDDVVVKYIKSGSDTGTAYVYSNDVKFSTSEKYRLIIESKKEYRVISAGNLGGKTEVTDNKATFTSDEFNSDLGEINITSSIAEINTVEVKRTDNKNVIAPEIPVSLTVKVQMQDGLAFDNYEVSGVEIQRLKSSNYKWDSVKGSVEGKLTLYYNDQTRDLGEVQVVATVQNTQNSKEVKSDILTLKINKDELVRGVDYNLSTNNIYYKASENDDPSEIYYKDENNKVTVYPKNYTEYRYTGHDFDKIDEGGSSFSAPSDTFDMQMRNVKDEKFGYSNKLLFIYDGAKPSITWSNKTEIKDNVYKFKKDTQIDLEVVDQGTGNNKPSGIANVYYAYEECKTNDEIIRSNPCIQQDGKYVISNILDQYNCLYIYAVDNVGNVQSYSISYEIDAIAPAISVESAEGFKLDNGIYYYSKPVNNNSTGSFEIKVSDKNFDQSQTGCTVTVDGKEPKLKEETTKEGCYYKIEVGDDKKEYTIQVSSKDLAGNSSEATYIIKVDNTAPDVKNVCVEPVVPAYDDLAGKVKDDFKSVLDGYNNFNGNSAVISEIEDDNYSSSRVAIKKGEDTIDITGIEEQGKYKYSFDGRNVITDSVELIATDKAGNETREKVKDAEKNGKAITEKKVAIISADFKFDQYKFNNVKDGTNYWMAKDGNVSGTLEYSCEFVNPDFLKVYLKDIKDDKLTPLDDATFKNGKIEITVPKTDLTDDHHYQVVAYYYDLASNSFKKMESSEYICDNKAPELEVNGPTIIEKDGKYVANVTYTMKESHPDFESFDFEGSTGVNNLATGLQQSVLKLLKDSSKWAYNNNNGKYTQTIQFETEGIYSLNVSVKDAVGYKSEETKCTFTFDKTAPEIANPVVETAFTKADADDYQHFANGTTNNVAKVTVSATDLVATEMQKAEYTLKDIDGTTKTIDVTKVEKKDNLFHYSFEISPSFKGTLKVSFTDNSGNSNEKVYEISEGKMAGIIVEGETDHKNTSSLAIKHANANTARKNVYKGAVNLKLEAADSYSGIKEVRYEIYNGINRVTSGTAADFATSKSIVTNWPGDVTSNLTIPKDVAYEGNSVTVKLMMTDNAGNTSELTSAPMKLDFTAPVIRPITFDNNNPQNEKYYNATRTATITIDELNLDYSDVSINVTKNGVPMSVTPNFHNTQGITHVMTIPFSEDGDYEITVSAVDMAGNASNVVKCEQFTIDKTNPDMSISFDNNNPYSGQYYGESRTATITVREHNFNASDVQVNVTASVDGSSVSAPSVGAFSTNGDVHTASITFNSDADYTISASCVDLAGNEGNNIEEQSFTVDLTAPEIEISGVTADESYTGSVSPVVTVTDGNYDTEGVTVSIVGGKHGKANVSSEVADIAHGQTYSFADLQHTQDNDDYYTLTAKAVDKAGHETEETIAYKVNRFGSVYVVNDALQAAIDQYYATSSDKYAIIEQNVDELESYSVSYSIDNDIVNLEEGDGYKVSHSTNKEDWQEYEYKLSADTFSKEGVYNITISSKDKAGNSSDNKSKDVTMEFCIDNTKPVCVISGVEENQEFEKGVSANIVVEAYDNIKFADMQVSVNGDQIKSEKDMTDGKVSFTIDPAKGAQTLKVVCHDAAGNETVQEIHFTFNVGVLGSGSPVAIIIIVIAAVLVAGGIFFIIAKKKKNNEK